MLEEIPTRSEILFTPAGLQVEYDIYGSGPPLVLVHGAFSDHRSNWGHVKPMLAQQFTVYAVARRGRGQTDATQGHELADEIEDLATVIRRVGEPVVLLGHSYGAHVALGTAAEISDLVEKLILYEPPKLGILKLSHIADLSKLAENNAWEALAWTFFSQVLEVPLVDLVFYRASGEWRAVVSDAQASFEDLSALFRHSFQPLRYSQLTMPVLLQTGSNSPSHLYMTDTLHDLLPTSRIEVLDGQAHEGMTTGPEIFVKSVGRFLADRPLMPLQT